jgi:UDP-N-acetyl-D-glucosamine dehydrogenase
VTYKKDISDSRESPAIEVIKLLLGLGANVVYSDPFVTTLSVDGEPVESVALSPNTLKACDLAIITTDHTTFDYVEIVRNAPLVFDTRNATDGLKAKNLVRL